MIKIILPYIFLAAMPSFLLAYDSKKKSVIPEAKSNSDKSMMMKLASSYVVRDLNGDQLCNLAKGDSVSVVGAADDGQRLQIQTVSGPCAGVKNGFVYVNYLRPMNTFVDKFVENAIVETQGLSLRKIPSVEDGTHVCSLPKDTKLNITNEIQKRNLWVEVSLKNPPKGCPDKGWVSASYLKPDLDLSLIPRIKSRFSTEAKSVHDCKDCDQNEISGGRKSTPKKTALAANEINAFVKKNSQLSLDVENPFIHFVKELQKSKKCPNPKQSDYKCNRGLVQMPADGNAGFCGTHHYSPDRPPGVDTHAAPHTACSLIALAQEWKKLDVLTIMTDVVWLGETYLMQRAHFSMGIGHTRMVSASIFALLIQVHFVIRAVQQQRETMIVK